MAVKTERFTGDLAKLPVIGIDSAVLIYHLEDTDPYSALTEELFVAVAGGAPRAVVSTVSVTEVLVKPFSEGRHDGVDAFEQFILSLPNTMQVAPDYAIAKDAARLRARYGLHTPDALLVATARHEGADGFVTNDGGLRKIKSEGLVILVLEDYV